LGRLIVTGYENKEKFPVNFGIEENTALIYTSKDNKLSVKGENGVVVVDLNQSSKENDEYKGINIGYLEDTDRFNLSDFSFEMDESKYTTIGYEFFYRENPVISGAVDADSSLKHMIAYNLIDNEAADTVKTYLFDNSSKGYVFEFSKTEATEGYWGQSGAADLYSFKNVQLSIQPVRISIEQSKVYVVQANDVLWKIALENETTVEKIIEINDLKNPNLIYENQIIKLP
jgi:LysM repeat protein